jgi:hypothetical protein
VKWQARTICTFIAASVPVERAGDVSPLLDAALSIGLEQKPEQKTENLPAGQLDFDPENPPMPNRDNSFEGFMGSFGSPGRWAGAN